MPLFPIGGNDASLPVLFPDQLCQLPNAATGAETLKRADLTISAGAALRQSLMTQFPRIPGRALKNIAVDHHARAQPSAKREKCHQTASFTRTPAPFSQRADIGVVFQLAWSRKSLARVLGEG